MAEKHTPGPWQAVVGNGAGDFWNIHRKTPTIDGGYFGRVDAMHWTEEARATARADARLIAAAPDLLAALQGMLEWARRVQERNPGMEIVAAHNAIAKATREG